ncbi:MAG: Maf family protein [Eubacteriales bacterium]|nr:Maf family protein [Eubacteriales bacterium]
MRIILASGSPRRRELLSQAGYAFTVEVSEVDERIPKEKPGKMVEELSLRKAKAVADTKKEMCTIIGADTVVALAGEILGKPEDEADAKEMLLALSGKTHQVYTGVSLLLMRGGECVGEKSFHVQTDVTMRKMTGEEIEDYIATGEPMDKAGAYGIQGKAAVFISGICGDYYNVVGLPICELTQKLAELWEENEIEMERC